MRTLNAEDLKRSMERREDLVLVDVVPEERFAREHIPGSYNVPAGRALFVREVEMLAGDRDRRVVVYGTNRRADAPAVAARRLESVGFGNVAHFAGGLREWKDAGHSVAASPQRG